MIYLDYSATTPMGYEVLDTYNKTCKDFFGNPNSLHELGVKTKNLMNSATKQIAEIFSIQESEITYTYGSTMGNNLALIGSALANHKKGQHIIVSKLEHPSIYAICDYLSSIGFEISYVKNDNEGLIDFEDLKKLIRPDTILVSICAVNSEVGVRQPLKMIRQIIKKENPNTILHSDMTQGVGKVSINLHDVDLATFTGHKIYGPKGIGILYKNNNINISPIIYGSGTTNMLNPGTPAVPLIVALSKAIRLATTDLEKRERFIERINQKLVDALSKYEGVMINKTKYSIPHILNISLRNIKAETFLHALEEYEIYLSTNTACSSGNLSTSVLAIYDDRVRASSTLRISLSHLTTTDEINKFIEIFEQIYKRLSGLQ
ncbi:MAG: cysteine desulfurase [Bacilli bacterium]|jgi:cysteine desulfurase|nr:cysteine desulfurase [Bacilli bacterium]MCX4254792.1 cysteine desulfurase family protein [Bacilli bacterium]